MIRLKGVLDPELRQLGLKAGDLIRDHGAPQLNGAIHFTVTGRSAFSQDFVVWKENYDFIEEGGKQ